MTCPNCTRKLIPPPGAPRFRCVCNYVFDLSLMVKCFGCGADLIPPPNAPTFRCVCGIILRRPAGGTGPGPSAPRPQIQPQAPPQPRGAAASAAPRPAAQTGTAPTQRRVRCPACSQLLGVPGNTRRFRCTCGEVGCSVKGPMRERVRRLSVRGECEG